MSLGQVVVLEGFDGGNSLAETHHNAVGARPRLQPRHGPCKSEIEFYSDHSPYKYLITLQARNGLGAAQTYPQIHSRIQNIGLNLDNAQTVSCI